MQASCACAAANPVQTCAKPARCLAAAAALGALLLLCHLSWQAHTSTRSRLHAVTGASGSLTATWRLAASAAARGRCSDEARLAAAVDALLASPLPPRNTNISLEAPLVYIHQRKAAGSSVRQAVVEGARRAGLPLFAACRGGVRCETFSLAGAPPSAVYAGHFPWAELRHLERHAPGWDAARAAGWRRSPRLGASCLTNFRDPLARLESCFYYKQAAALKVQAKVGLGGMHRGGARCRQLGRQPGWAGGENCCTTSGAACQSLRGPSLAAVLQRARHTRPLPMLRRRPAGHPRRAPPAPPACPTLARPRCSRR